MVEDRAKGIGRRGFLSRMAAVGGVAATGAIAWLWPWRRAPVPADRRNAPPATPAAPARRAPDPSAAASREAHAPTFDEVATPPVPAGPEVRALFGGIREGMTIGRWRIVAIHDVRMGAIPVVMSAADGSTFQVDVLRRDRTRFGRSGVADTSSLSLFLSNGGRGSTPTMEEHGLGVMALARALAWRESHGAAIPPLLTWNERRILFPGGEYRVLV